MNLEPFTGPGSTPSRRRFWDKVTAYVIASQKVAGSNVSTSEHHGAGTLINVVRGRGGNGACCDDEGGCTITTESECTGTFQGVGTVCDPNPCGTGACCIDGECSILNAADCASAGGIYQGDGTACDPNPCVCCGGECCGSETPFMDGDGNCWTQVSNPCDGSGPIYSGSSPCDAIYSHIVQTTVCCPPTDPELTMIINVDEFCNHSGDPFCDNTQVCTCPDGEGSGDVFCDPDTCTLHCGGGSASSIQEVSNLCDC